MSYKPKCPPAASPSARISSVFALALWMIAAGQPCRALEPCCKITSIDGRTGVVTAQVNASGQTFQFKAGSGVSPGRLAAGQPIYANLKTGQVSLDGQNVCCRIISAGAAPAMAGKQQAAPGTPSQAPVPLPIPSPSAGSPTVPTVQGTSGPFVSSVTLDPAHAVGGKGITVTVTLSAPAPSGGVFVDMSATDPSSVRILGTYTHDPHPEKLLIPPGKTQWFTNLETAPVATGTTATVTAARGPFNSKTATLQILPPTFAGFTMPNNDTGGDPNAVVSFLFTGPTTGSANAAVGFSCVSPDPNNPVTAPGTSHFVCISCEQAPFQCPNVPAKCDFHLQLPMPSEEIVAACRSYAGSPANAVTQEKWISIKPLKLGGVSFIREAGLYGHIRVWLNGPAPAGGATIDVNPSENIDVAQPLVVPAGKIHGYANVRLPPCDNQWGGCTGLITVSYAGVSATAKFSWSSYW